MMINLKNNLWIPVLLLVLCGCIYIFSEDKCESVFLDDEKKSKEDWFVYNGEFYEKTGEDVYEKSDFPKTVQSVMQEEGNAPDYLRKEENRLIIESEYYFYIYDFETDHMEEYSTGYGHLGTLYVGQQICQETIYFVEKTGDDEKRLMAYDMVSGNVKQIDTGEYEPLQFYVRLDGAIGMWGVNAKGDKEYCFWENGTPVYVADKDESFGWTYLCGFTENGIILKREYDDLWRGTKTYIISKDGTMDILASISDSISDRENPKVLPEAYLIYEDDRIVAIDMTSGLVKAYDYDLSYMGEPQWDIEVSEDMEFVDYNVEGDGIWGIWKMKDKNVYKRAALR